MLFVMGLKEFSKGRRLIYKFLNFSSFENLFDLLVLILVSLGIENYNLGIKQALFDKLIELRIWQQSLICVFRMSSLQMFFKLFASYIYFFPVLCVT